MLSNPTVTTFSLPRAGHTEEEYEDASCTASEMLRGRAISRCAVADSATETSFAGMWARFLVEAFCQGRLSAEEAAETLETLRRQWGREISRLSLPWFAEDKAQQGAFATFCGVTLSRGRGAKSWKWQAQAVGDSCMLHIRGDEIVKSFPLAKSSEFGNTPHMICSVEGGGGQSFAEAKGEGTAGDRLLLMTDALACSFLHQVEAGASPAGLADRMQTAQAFADFIEESRNALAPDGERRLKNDDVTLVMVAL